MDQSRTATNRKSDWVATEGSFAAFLEWLDQGFENKGAAYLKIRGRLVTYFDRKGCLCADDLADETLNRVQRRLEEEGTIDADSPAKFCYAVAKYVFLEYLRSGRAKEVSDEFIDQGAIGNRSDTVSGEDENRGHERALSCLESCIAKLDAEHRELVIEYYRGEQRAKIENRRQLAAKYGLTLNALSIRAFRIRERLELCVRRCIDGVK